MPPIATKSTLVSALCKCVENQQRRKTRQFLEGLSTDELQYIAEFLGSCILESRERDECSRLELADGIRHFEMCRRGKLGPSRHANPKCIPEKLEDDQHKMILLLEYLCRSGLTKLSIAMRAGQT